MESLGRVSILPKGTAFTRAAIALMIAKGTPEVAINIVNGRWRGDLDAIKCIEKSTIAAGTTTDGSWASALAQPGAASAEFSALLRAGSIAGRLTGMRHVPFNVRYAKQTGSSTVGWVGQGAAAPVSKLSLTVADMAFSKVSGICVFTSELARLSDPDAEGLIRNDLVATTTDYLDQQFISPGVAAISDVSPASITYGITPTQSTGNTATQIASDLATLATTLADANETDSLFWIMSRSDAIRLAAKRDTAGAPAFPGVTVSGGTLLGIPVIVSNNVPHSASAGTVVVLVNASAIDYADSRLIELDVSSEALVQMDTSPTNNGVTPTATTMVSLWQDNLLAVKMVAYRNYVRRRDTGVAVLDNVRW